MPMAMAASRLYQEAASRLGPHLDEKSLRDWTAEPDNSDDVSGTIQSMTASSHRSSPCRKRRARPLSSFRKDTRLPLLLRASSLDPQTIMMREFQTWRPSRRMAVARSHLCTRDGFGPSGIASNPGNYFVYRTYRLICRIAMNAIFLGRRQLNLDAETMPATAARKFYRDRPGWWRSWEGNGSRQDYPPKWPRMPPNGPPSKYQTTKR